MTNGIRIQLLFLLTVSTIILFSFCIDSDKALAVVEQRKGLSLFILSTPKSAYEVVGHVKKTFAWGGGTDELFNGLIDKAKKEYPNADGIIFDSLEFEKADVIKFKQ